MMRKPLLTMMAVLLTACSLLPQQTPPTAAPTAPPATQVALPTAALAATPIATPAETKPAKTIRGGFLQEPSLLVPYFARTSDADRLAQLYLLGLAARNEKGDLIPTLAEAIPSTDNGGVAKDGLTVTWKLKKDIKWADGTPLTSKDVKATWQAIMDTRNIVASRTGYDAIETLDTPDNTTVVLKFKYVYLDWADLFTVSPAHTGVILPEIVIKGKGGLETDNELRQLRFASGPFQLSEWKQGANMILTANPNFYKGKPKVDRIEIKFFPTNAEGLKALAAGELDWYADFAEADMAALQGEAKVQKQFVPLAEYEQLFFNFSNVKGVDNKGKADADGPCVLKELKFRKALVLGINRAAINEKVFAGKALIPATPWGLSAAVLTTLKPDAYDPEAAKKLLDELGYKAGNDGIRTGKCGGKDTRLFFNLQITNKKLRQDVMQMVQADLNKIGVDVRPTLVDAQKFFGSYTEGADLMTGKFELASFSYPERYMPEWTCASVPSKENPTGLNVAHYCDPALDKLLADSMSLDAATRRKALEAIQKYFAENYLGLVLHSRLNVYGFSERFVPAPFGANDMFWNAEEWDVK